MSVRWCSAAVFTWCLTGVFSFNLDPRIPVIKNGAAETFFGFSVALHQSIEERLGGPERKDWILVGAPLGQNLQPETEKSGALWKCPLSTISNDCSQVVTDGKRAVEDSQLFPPSEKELKDGQWMGVTVRSQGAGKKVLVCAHRYIERGPDYQWGQGLCYTLTQDLQFNEPWQPCLNKDTSRAHEQYGYCQAGTSGMLTEDDGAVIGLPGPYTWRGTIFAVNISDDFLARDKTQYFGPVTEQRSPVDKYSYLGMAVAYGRFFPGREKSFVGGAPRSNGTGQVVFFSKVREGQKTLRVDLILDGEMFASQFGYELCALDFNGDGMTDLVVGAPFHFTDTTGGAIYIYRTESSGLTPRTEPERLLGAPESRFGFAMANLGDLNKDGYEDLAVGAPFEGAGVVRIYLGSREGLNTEPAQVIPSEQVAGAGAPITFGYALGGGVDIDGNGYPDLAVGSFCNDTVALIRARPIVGIQTRLEGLSQLQNIDPTVIECRTQPSSTDKCVTFKACFRMESLDRLKTTVKLEYRLEAETFRPGRRLPRVYFLDGLRDRPHIVTRTLPLRLEYTQKDYCHEETMFIRTPARDIQTPIQLQLTYALQQREPRQAFPGGLLPDIDQYPILNQQQASRIFQAKFVKNCGLDDICRSEVILKPEFDLRKDEQGFSVLELGTSGQELRVNVSAINRGESAYDARMFVQHSPDISFVAKEPKDSLVCSTPDEQTVVCDLGNPLERGRYDMLLRFDVSQLEDRSDMIEMGFFANTTSVEENPQPQKVIRARVAKRSELSVNGLAVPEQSFYGGEVRGEAAYKFLDEIGNPVLHTYEVYNGGPSTVDWVDVQIDWPAQVQSTEEEGKWLLYITKPPFVQGDGECYLDKVHINPLNLAQRVEEPSLLQSSVVGAYIGAYQPSSGAASSSSSTSSTTSTSSKSTSSSSTKITTSSSSSSSSSRISGSSSSSADGSRVTDVHDRVVVEDTTYRGKSDYGSGGRLNAVDSGARKPSGVDEELYRRRRPLDPAGGRRGNYQTSSSSSSRRVYGSRVAGDTEDDYRGRYGAEDDYRGRYGITDDDYRGRYGQPVGRRRDPVDTATSTSYRRTYQTSRTSSSSSDKLDSSAGRGVGSTDTRYGGTDNVYGGPDKTDGDSAGVYGSTERRYGSTGSSAGGVVTDRRYTNTSTESRYGAGSSTGQRYGSGSSVYGAGSVSDRRYGQTSSVDRTYGQGSSVDRAYGQGSSVDRTYGGGSAADGDRRYIAGRVGAEGEFDAGSAAAGSGFRTSVLGVGDEEQYGRTEDAGVGDESRGAGGAGGRLGGGRRRGGRYRGYYRRRYGPQADSGNQTYRYQRRYESRQPYRGQELDLEGRRRQLSQQRVPGGREQVQASGDGYSRHYQARQPLEGTGYEEEEIHEQSSSSSSTNRRRRRRTEPTDPAGRSRRVKREREMVVMPEAVTDSSGKVHQVVFMDCTHRFAKCVRFKCRVNNLPKNEFALVHVQARVWNSTLVEDYADASWVSIKSRATLQMDPSLEKLQDITDDVDEAETLAYPELPREAEDGGVPIWVIVVSVLAGLLLLAIIALILWKLGFFKRRRPDPTLKSNISR